MEWRMIGGAVAVVLMVVGQVTAQDAEPRVVSAPAGQPPSDAVVLFGGMDASQWRDHRGGGPARWSVEAGAMSSGPGTILTRAAFGDMQLHVEFATPAKVEGEGQGRGNSGVYLLGLYELQVLDSYNNPTYIDGMCGAFYKQYPPLVNASRGPGQWQTYDIILRTARFDAAGTKTRNAVATVIHNGVLIQDHVELSGPTPGGLSDADQPTGPIMLQDHRNPVRFRNIWVRRLD